MVSDDKKWFRLNPMANHRIREPQPGEVDELARTMLPKDTEWEGSFASPSPETPWRILAVRLPLRRVARMLTLASPDQDGDLHLMPIALGERMALN